MKRTFLSFRSFFILPAVLLLASCSGGRELELVDASAGGEVQTSSGGAAGHHTTGSAGGASGGAGGQSGGTGTGGGTSTGGSGGAGGVAGAGGATGTGGAAIGGAGGMTGPGGAAGATGTGGAGPGGRGGMTGPGGAAGAGGATGTGGAPVGCSSTQHLCSGTCVDNTSTQHCGTLCSPCTPPVGATATCDGSSCGYTCAGSTPKNCATQRICVASTGCCSSADCAGSGPCAGSCNGSGSCSYPTVSCGTVSCSGNSAEGLGTCSRGTCMMPAPQSCGGHLVCGQNMCKSTCTVDADCESGYFCGSGSCHLAAVAIATGEWHACVLLTDGSVRCWGSGFAGQLGNGMSDDTGFESSATPVAVIGLPGPASAIAAGQDTTCALIKNDGSIWCWGDGSFGQLGTGSVPAGAGASKPGKVSLGSAAAASAISMGFEHVCAIVSGSVYCWGRDSDGQVGNGQFNGAGVLTPTKVSGLSGVTALACGDYHTCAAGGSSIWCWGDNDYGELGNGQFNDPISLEGSATPQPVSSALKDSPILALTAGSSISCALVGSGGFPGGVYCWGDNEEGQLGVGTVTTTSPPGIPSPQAVTGLTGPTIVNAGGYEACAVNGNGALLCWGDRNDSDHDPDVFPTPGVVMGLSTPVIAVSSSTSSFACALTKNGAAWCWAPQNLYGILGSATLSGSTTPVQIPGW
jgi:alpha-tubulin suppressor-like RCC1 family protein